MDRIDKDGREVLDDTPVELPIGYRQPKPLDERIREMVRINLSQVAEEKGYETFSEANDFDVGDDDHIDGLIVDEDDEFAANDPFLEKAVEMENKRIRKKKQNSAKNFDPKAKPLEKKKEDSPKEVKVPELA